MQSIVDIRGERFGSRTIIGIAESKFGRARFYARCDCGSVSGIFGHHIRNGKGLSCRACKRKAQEENRKRELEKEFIGKNVGMRVIEAINYGRRRKTGSRAFVAETVCRCGYRASVEISALKRGRVDGCISCAKKSRQNRTTYNAR